MDLKVRENLPFSSCPRLKKKEKEKRVIRRFKLAIVKSKLLKQLSRNFPNFLKKDLEKLTNIILEEIKKTLKRGERVEIRGFGVFSTNTQKARISKSKTGESAYSKKKNNSLQNG